MRKAIIALCILVAACGPKDVTITGTAPPREVPELTSKFSQKAQSLEPITDKTMGGAHVQGAKDDMKYNALAKRYNELLDVYNCVRTSLKEDKELKLCLK